MFGIPFTANQRVIFLYYIILVLALVTNFFTLRVRRLPVGRAWEALREDETACRALGINPTNTKLTAFAIGAMFAGFAGSFFAAKQGFISPESFTFIESAIILAIVVLGGMGSQIGVVLAAVVLIGLPEWFRDLGDYRMLAFGLGHGADHGVAAARPARASRADDPLVRWPRSARRARRDGATRHERGAPLLEVEHLTMRFGGLVAVDDVSFAARRREITGDHRPERRRQDDGLQLHHRLLQADGRPADPMRGDAAATCWSAWSAIESPSAPASRAPSRTSACSPA